MDYFGLVAGILKTGLHIWELKQEQEARKYLDLVIKLEGIVANEKKKPVFVQGMSPHGNYCSDAVLDDCMRELAVVARGFASAAGKTVP